MRMETIRKRFDQLKEKRKKPLTVRTKRSCNAASPHAVLPDLLHCHPIGVLGVGGDSCKRTTTKRIPTAQESPFF